jgi:hypothetical protein
MSLYKNCKSTLCEKVCQWFMSCCWFSPVTAVSSTSKTDCHDITEILLKVVLNTIILPLKSMIHYISLSESGIRTHNFRGDCIGSCKFNYHSSCKFNYHTITTTTTSLVAFTIHQLLFQTIDDKLYILLSLHALKDF